MKNNHLATALLLASLAAPSCLALSDAQAKAVKKAIVSVSTPEIPAKAVELVSKASKDDQESVAVAAVRAAIYKSRTSASLVVAAISKAKPELAATVVRTASEMECNQVDAIAIAAMNAAPEAKARIVASASEGSALGAAVEASTAPTAHPVTIALAPMGMTLANAAFTRSSESHPVEVTVNTFTHPINEHSGGNGNGRFDMSPPHGGHPPGLNGQPGRHGPPEFVDYTKPRDHH